MSNLNLQTKGFCTTLEESGVDCEKSQDRFPFDADVCSFGVWIAYCDAAATMSLEDRSPNFTSRKGHPFSCVVFERPGMVFCLVG